MKHWIFLFIIIILLVGCTLPTPGVDATATLSPSVAADPSGTPVFDPSPTPTSTQINIVDATPTPTSCTGWNCTLSGFVCLDSGDSCDVVEGVLVSLSQSSYCSPTTGEHETITGPDGTFAFDVYLHDTDSFLIEVEHDGYEPASVLIGGFDCLFCSCPSVDFQLEPLETP
jgi:hypothetical protein